MTNDKKSKAGEEFVKFDQLLAKAKIEGRIDGPHKCVYCGMRHLGQKQSRDCCKSL